MRQTIEAFGALEFNEQVILLIAVVAVIYYVSAMVTEVSDSYFRRNKTED